MKSLSFCNLSYCHHLFLSLASFVLTFTLFSPLCLFAAEAENSPDFPQLIFWEYEYEQALKRAGEKSGVVFTYVYSNDCDWCRKMEEETFSHPEVIKFSRDHVFLKLNGDGKASKPVMERYEVRHLPTLMVLSHSGEELYRESNYLDPSRFLRELHQFNQAASRRSRTDSQDRQSLTFHLDYAKKAFRHLEFMEATKALDYILSKDPENYGGLNDEALLLFGTSLVYLYQLHAAEVLLARLCLEYPESKSVPDAMYILGEIYIQTSRREWGRNLLEKLIREYPKHAMAQRAKAALQRVDGKEGW